VNESPTSDRPVRPAGPRIDWVLLAARVGLFLVLPMLLLAAVTPAQGCGGG
jgi:hypothetical protein